MIAFMAVSPHGDELLKPTDEESKRLASAMEEVKTSLSGIPIDTTVVITPHNIRIPDHLAVVSTQYLEGQLRGERVSLPVNRELAAQIFAGAKVAGLPVVSVNYGALDGPESSLPLDWGSSIPLEFFYKSEKLVIVCPAREITREALVEFGRVMARCLEAYQGNVSVIVSADNAHAHSQDGPYGYSPMAKVYDDLVVSAFKKENLGELMGIADSVIEEAKPDSFWQFLIMLGILEVKRMKPKFLAYGRPTYFGMMVAYFNP
ncbi:MAG: extradiol dioxygenase [Candidatus Marsarchaeota archaeon]